MGGGGGGDEKSVLEKGGMEAFGGWGITFEMGGLKKFSCVSGLVGSIFLEN